ncbi:MAG: EF-P beta-lysylation protein EpmB [Motiliproteus sp.]
MHTKSLKLISQPSWQQILASSVSDPRELLQRLQLPEELLTTMTSAHGEFAVRVPEPYLQRIEPGNPKDPLLLQVLPRAQEMLQVAGFIKDPLAEQQANQHQGIIHKYQGRLLLIISGGCAINCRYCFRRHFPYGDNQLGKEEWSQALDYIRQDSSITEVIFSGGDPLATSDQRLASMINELDQIPHLKRLRIHSRLPVVIPQRITEELLNTLQQSRLDKVLVTHINHPKELDPIFKEAMSQLKLAGITLLNQSVLLKDINDNHETLCELSESLFEAGILPYYLHLLDPVAGASHFDVNEQQARKLVGQLCDQLPGYLVPKLVKELAGASAKVPLTPVLKNSG